MIRRSATLLTLVLLAPLSGCEQSPVIPGPSSFVATVDGDVSSRYVGTGHFAYGSARRPAAPLGFVLHSAGTGEAAGQGIELYRGSRETVEAGSYPVGVADGAFHAVYTRREGNVVERYSARDGELRFEEAGSGRMSGTFRFTAVLSATCTVQASSQSCSVLGASADAPVVEVNGSFQAVPARR